MAGAKPDQIINALAGAVSEPVEPVRRDAAFVVLNGIFELSKDPDSPLGALARAPSDRESGRAFVSGKERALMREAGTQATLQGPICIGVAALTEHSPDEVRGVMTGIERLAANAGDNATPLSVGALGVWAERLAEQAWALQRPEEQARG